MFFLILVTFFYSICATTDYFVVDLTCTDDGFILHIEQRETGATLSLRDIVNGGYLQKSLDQTAQSDCDVAESHFNVENGFIEQSFPYTACGKFDVTDQTYSTTLVYRLD